MHHLHINNLSQARGFLPYLFEKNTFELEYLAVYGRASVSYTHLTLPTILRV